MKIKFCEICGRSFDAKGNTKCCSEECSKKARAKLVKETNQRTSKERQSYMKENARSKMERGRPRKKGDGNKSLVTKNKEARALGISYGKYAAREAAAAVKVNVNIEREKV